MFCWSIEKEPLPATKAWRNFFQITESIILAPHRLLCSIISRTAPSPNASDPSHRCRACSRRGPKGSHHHHQPSHPRGCNHKPSPSPATVETRVRVANSEEPALLRKSKGSLEAAAAPSVSGHLKGVDKRAEEFISRFHEQMKLQEQSIELLKLDGS